MKRIFCINARGEARLVRVLSHSQFVAWLPAQLCTRCDEAIHQDLTTIHQDEPCPHCGAATFAF
jgi:ribosomal protein S27AE